MLPIIRPTIGPAVPAASPAARANSGFRLPEAAPAAAAPPPPAASALGGLLGLQEAAGAMLETTEAVRDRRARQHGRALLDGVAALQLALLRDAGADGMAQPLKTLSALLEQAPVAADPGLRALLGSVTLRVRVELARHGR